MYESDADKTKEAVQAILRKGPIRLMVIAAGVIIFILIFFRPWVQVGPGQRGMSTATKKGGKII